MAPAGRNHQPGGSRPEYADHDHPGGHVQGNTFLGRPVRQQAAPFAQPGRATAPTARGPGRIRALAQSLAGTVLIAPRQVAMAVARELTLSLA